MADRVALARCKPTQFKYNVKVEEACQFLGSMRDAPSDMLVPYFIRVCRIIEDIDRVFEYSNPQGVADMDDAQLEVTVKYLEREVAEFRESLPPEVCSNSELT